MEPFEDDLRTQGISAVAGIDEVGRGALFGPVLAAAVILPEVGYPEGLADSKQVPPVRRLELFREIQLSAIDWAVGLASAREIDRINILRATKRAMVRAVAGLRCRPQHLLIDALKLEDLELPQTAIIKGDARCRSIAAASIVAKCVRDSLVRRWSLRVTGYGLEHNMGYATREHLDAIMKRGHTELHRRSFRVQGTLPFEEVGAEKAP